MGFPLAKSFGSFLLAIMLIAGSFWIYDIMVSAGYVAWWQWIIPIAFAGLVFVGAMKAIWS